MKSKIIHCIGVCMAVLAHPLLVACGSHEESLPENNATEAALYLNIETVGQSRSVQEQLPDNEKMKSVRVIVLHADGTVEHNRHFSLDGAQIQKFILLKVKPAEQKKIFLFANEESVSAVEGVTGVNGATLTEFFNRYTIGSPSFSNDVNKLYFAPDYSAGKPIPMSSMYEIEFPEKGNVEKTFYMVRVATKFMVNFKNWRSEEVTVNKFTIKSYADKNFLMAHVNDSEQNRQLFNGKTWIEWLKDVSEASSENDDYATTEAAGWLKDYELPEQADRTKTYDHGPVVISAPAIDKNNPDKSKPGLAKTAPVFYLPESMNPKEEAADGEQEYILTININGRIEPFALKLPNLKALFRNTSVVVNISLYNSTEIVVDVIPYSEVTLEPEFGI